MTLSRTSSHGISRERPYAAAARAADLSGLPPTFISVGGLDLFLEENMTYAGLERPREVAWKGDLRGRRRIDR